MEEIPNADVVNSRASKNFQISNGESEECITLGNLYANTKFKHFKTDVSKFILCDIVLLNKDKLNYSWKNATGVVHMIFFKLT